MGRADGPSMASSSAARRTLRRGWWSIDRLLLGSLVLSATAHAAVGIVAKHADPPPVSSTAMTLELYAAIDPAALLEDPEEAPGGSWDYAPEPDAPAPTDAQPEAPSEPEPEPPVALPETETPSEPDAMAAATPEPAAVEPEPVEPLPATDPVAAAPDPILPAADPIAVDADPQTHPDVLPAEPRVAAAEPVDPNATPSSTGERAPARAVQPPAARDANTGGAAASHVAPLSGDERRGLERLRARFDRRLGTRIDRSVRWPRHLLTADIEGVVVVGFRFDESGRVVDVVVVESSGHEALDQAAVQQIADLRLPEWDPALAAIDDRYREVPLHFDPTG